MTDEDEALLLALSRVGRDSGDFALGVLENSMSRDDQIAFGHRLVNLAEAIRERALRTAGPIIEGSVNDNDNTEQSSIVR
ncbi:MAG: hypothetical protein ACRDSP_09505 [Pseudonocardiaceae bacterium]